MLEWDNLLPSCKRCNGTKNAHDVVAEPIINPCIDNPNDHLALYYSFIYGTTPKGECTVDTLNLNDNEKLVKTRNRIVDSLIERLDSIFDKIPTASDRQATKSRFRNRVKNLMSECLPDKEYAAVCSCALLHHPHFMVIVNALHNLGIWDNGLEEMSNQINDIALDRL